MYSSNKKPKIDPMNLDFDFMIRNHPEFFTKLSSQNFNHPPLPTPRLPPPASWGFSGFSRLPPVPGGFSRRSSVPDDYLGTGRGRRTGGPGATLKPKIYPPTLMRNPKPKRGGNNFFK
jgi:hypothetical protein